LYDPEKTDPEKLAYRDRGEFIVEKILDHVGDPTKSKTTYDFLVQWQGYPSEENLWLPWKSLKDNVILHQYLVSNNLNHFVPKKSRKMKT
jgi:hypothetical protein